MDDYSWLMLILGRIRIANIDNQFIWRIAVDNGEWNMLVGLLLGCSSSLFYLFLVGKY